MSNGTIGTKTHLIKKNSIERKKYKKRKILKRLVDSFGNPYYIDPNIILRKKRE